MEVDMGDGPLVLTVEESATLLGISRGLAYELVRRGSIPSIRLGRRLVVPRRRLLAMIEGDRTEVADRDPLGA
jgi:excisionase family DNA binding protein